MGQDERTYKVGNLGWSGWVVERIDCSTWNIGVVVRIDSGQRPASTTCISRLRELVEAEEVASDVIELFDGEFVFEDGGEEFGFEKVGGGGDKVVLGGEIEGQVAGVEGVGLGDLGSFLAGDAINETTNGPFGGFDAESGWDGGGDLFGNGGEGVAAFAEIDDDLLVGGTDVVEGAVIGTAISGRTKCRKSCGVVRGSCGYRAGIVRASCGVEAGSSGGGCGVSSG